MEEMRRKREMSENRRGDPRRKGAGEMIKRGKERKLQKEEMRV